MKRRDLIASAAALAGLSGCGVLTASHTLQYRLTLTVNAEGALRTGSAVLKTVWADTLGLGQGDKWSGKYWGDAIIVMQSGASALVGMLGRLPNANGFSLPFRTVDSLMTPTERGLSSERRRIDALSRSRSPRDLPPDQWPLMTYISDVRNLASAILISKEKPNSRFSIQRFTLAATSDSISRGIETQLPCLTQIGTYHPNPVAPVDEIPAYQLFNRTNFSVSGVGI